MGMMMTNLFTSDPRAILPTTGSSRAGVRPCTYCGVTAASSMTTPAAFADAFIAALRMSSTTASSPTDMRVLFPWWESQTTDSRAQARTSSAVASTRCSGW